MAENSTFAARRAARTGAKQVRQAENKAVQTDESKTPNVEDYHVGNGWYEVPGSDKKLRRDDAVAALGR